MKQKKLLASLMAFIMCLSAFTFCVFENEADAYGETFILDPGHGGSDPGACAYGRQEAADVLALAFKVGELISTRASVTYTRTGNTTLSLAQRCSIANNGGNSYFCSIHRNAGGGTGIETYYYTSNASYNMAYAVNSRIAKAVPWANRGVKSAAFYVIKYTNMTSILTEVGFIDTPADNTNFVAYNDEIAYAIADGLLSYAGYGSPITVPVELDGMTPGAWGDFYSTIINRASGHAIAGLSEEILTGQEADGSLATHWYFKYMGNYEYEIINLVSGFRFDLDSKEDKNDVDLWAWKDSSSAAQRYFIYDRGDGYYSIRPKTTISRVLDIYPETGRIVTWDYDKNSLTNQWDLVSTSANKTLCTDYGAEFKGLISLGDSKYLTYNGKGNAITAEELDYTSDKQMWIFKRQPHTNYQIISNDGCAIEVSDITVGSSVTAAEASDSENQQFYIYNYYENTSTCFGPAGARTNLLGVSDDGKACVGEYYGSNNEFRIRRVDLNGQMPEILGDFESAITSVVNNWSLTASGSAGSAASCQASAGTDAFMWQFKYIGHYEYEISNKASGLRLDTPEQADKDDVDLAVYADNDSSAQRFYIYKNENGNYFIKPKCCVSRVLDTYRASGRTVTWSFTGASETNQWKLDAPDARLELGTGSSYTEDRTTGYVGNVAENTAVSDILSNFKNADAYVVNAEGTKLSEDGIVGTGCKVCLGAGEAVTDSLTIIIKGDVDGNGISDSTDYLRVKQFFLGSFSFNGAYFTAGDADGNGVIDTTDYLKIKNAFLS